MNAFQQCSYTADAVPLYLPQQLFLKPIARVEIVIQIPQKKTDECIPNWDIMEALRKMIRPEEFTLLKSTKTTVEQLVFIAEVCERGKIKNIISKLDGRTLKLSQYSGSLKLRVCIAKSEFPTKYAWDSFFRDATDMNESKPGERPDTIHLSHLPIKWFVPYHLSGDEDVKPSEKIIKRVFDKFGKIRHIDIPLADPFRNRMKSHMSGVQAHPLTNKDLFEVYIQFKEYTGFCKAMDALYGMKLMYKDDDAVMADIKVSFDKTKHLSDASIRRRGIVRDRLMEKQRRKDREDKMQAAELNKKKTEEEKKKIELRKEKQKRRSEREEKRKQKFLEKLKGKSSDDLNMKIAREEKKLLKVQRKLEAIRLVEELFKRIQGRNISFDSPKVSKRMPSPVDSSGYSELTRLKLHSEGEVRMQRDKLHEAIEGRLILKSVLADDSAKYNYSSSDEDTKNKVIEKTPVVAVPPGGMVPMVEPQWYNHPADILAYHQQIPRYQEVPQNYYPFPRGRGYNGRGFGFAPRRQRFRGRGRGGYNQSYPPEMEEAYSRYFQKFLNEHDNRGYPRSRSRGRSYSRSRSRSYSKRRSYSRSRSRDKRSRNRRSYSRSRSRSRSASKRRSRNSRSRSRDRSSSRQRRNHSSSRSYTPKRNDRSRSASKDRDK